MNSSLGRNREPGKRRPRLQMLHTLNPRTAVLQIVRTNRAAAVKPISEVVPLANIIAGKLVELVTQPFQVVILLAGGRALNAVPILFVLRFPAFVWINKRRFPSRFVEPKLPLIFTYIVGSFFP